MTDSRLDTNHLTRLTDRGGLLRRRVDAARVAGGRFFVCAPVVVEALMWVLRNRRRTTDHRTFRAVLEHAETTEEDAKLSASLRLRLRSRGFLLHLPDALIAAVALRRGLTLPTADRDFAAVPGLRVEDWLGP